MSQGTPTSVNRGHLISVFSGQLPSVLTTEDRYKGNQPFVL